jgi:hypothetical protein
MMKLQRYESIPVLDTATNSAHGILQID